MENTKKSLKKNEEAVSPVIGVIMLIAITVIIAAVVAAFAYGIIGGVQKAPSSAMVLEGSNAGSVALTIIHHGGDSIIDAFKGTGGAEAYGDFYNIEIRRNGATVNLTSSTLNGNDTWNLGVAANTAAFTPGDELALSFADGLDSGDSLVVLYKPTGDILQRTTVT